MIPTLESGVGKGEEVGASDHPHHHPSLGCGGGVGVPSSKVQGGEAMRVVITVGASRWELPRHDIAEVPASLLDSLGYVEFAGSTTLKRAEYRGGRWVDHRRRPFEQPPVAWYSLAGMKNAAG